MKYNKINIKYYLHSDFPNVTRNSKEEEKVNYLSEIGIIRGKKDYQFDCNKFSRFFLKHTDVVLMTNEEIAIYDQIHGYYIINAESTIKKIIKYMFNRVEDTWSLFREKSAIESIKRDIVTVVDGVNDSNFVNLKNGLLSLKDFKLYPHSKDVFSITQIPIEYTTSQPTPVLDKFICDIAMGDQELILILQEVAGYVISNKISAEKAFFCIGTGANGKSSYVRLLENLIGDKNCSHTPLSAFGKNFGLASLIGCTANIAAENNSSYINSEIFKAIVSGDKIEINIKYKPDLNVSLSTKLICLFNELPECNDASFGYFRRLLIIPFRNTFRGSDVDINMSSKLESELPGIFFWAIEGLKRLQKNNYQFTKSIVCSQALEEYRATVNPIEMFFKSVFEVDPDAQIKKSDIYKYYEKYCEDNAYGQLQLQKFWKLLRQHLSNTNINYSIKKIKGVEYIKGFNINDFFEESNDSVNSLI